MKNATEWLTSPNISKRATEQDYLKWVQQIQLDAMKEGMRRAERVITERSDLLEKNGVKGLIREYYHQKALLDAAEQLTEKDL